MRGILTGMLATPFREDNARLSAYVSVSPMDEPNQEQKYEAIISLNTGKPDMLGNFAGIVRSLFHEYLHLQDKVDVLDGSNFSENASGRLTKTQRTVAEILGINSPLSGTDRQLDGNTGEMTEIQQDIFGSTL